MSLIEEKLNISGVRFTPSPSWIDRLLVIIPAYNEEQSVGQVIDQVKNFYSKASILVVDDGSDDETSQVALKREAKVARIPFNSGIGVAMRVGYSLALQMGYDYAVQIDADGQHDPRFIEKLMTPLLKNDCDLVIGSRFIEDQGYRSSLARRIGIRFFSFLIFWLTGKWITDPTSGNRAMNRSVLELLAVDYPSDYPEPESLVTLSQKNLRVKEVPIVMDPRSAGRSSISLERAVYYMIKVSLAILFRAFGHHKEKR